MLRRLASLLPLLLILAAPATESVAQAVSPVDPLKVIDASNEPAPQVTVRAIQDFSGNPDVLEGSALEIEMNPLFVQPVSTEVASAPLQIGSAAAPPLAARAPQHPAEEALPHEAVVSPQTPSSVASKSVANGPIGIPDHYAVAGDQALIVAAPGFLGNDIDLDGEPLTATVLTDTPDNGTLSAFPSGGFTYTPNDGFTGTDSFAYRMRDASFNVSDPVTVTVEVLEPSNRNPIGTPDEYATTSGTTLVIAAPGFLSNDIDLDGEALTATVLTDTPDNGTVAAFPSGSFNYTPNAGFTGTDSFEYRMRDASFNDSAPVTVTIHVFEANRSPIGAEDAYATLINTPLVIAAPGFLSNDVDLDGEALTATVLTDTPDNGTVSALPSGGFTYTPDNGFTGTDSFEYRMRDASFNVSDPITVTLHVLAEGTTPVGIPDFYVVANDQTLGIAAPGFLGNDIDLDGEPLTATVLTDSPNNGSVVALPSGGFTYTPNAGFVGTDSFDYRMRDASLNPSGDVTVTIEVVEPANRNPIGIPDAYAMASGTTLSVAAAGFLANDLDLEGEALTATVLSDTPNNGSVVAFPDGSFNYTPNPGFTGTDSFDYRMRDASLNASGDVTVTIHVYEANRGPVGVEDAYATLINTPLSIVAPGFLGNDVDLEGDALTATVLSDVPDNGFVVAFPSGAFTYTPNPGFTGTDSFEYRMRDAALNPSGDVTVTILVIDPLAPPPPVECTITTLAEGAPYKDAGVGKIDITFSNPDGIAQIEFSVLDNFVASSSDFVETDAVNNVWTGGPLTTVAFTLSQDDPTVSKASYFAIASSVCPNEQDGSLETDFDPVVHFPVEVPGEHALSQNFPNPFNPSTTISFALPEESAVRLTVYDAMGREVQVLVDGVLDAGLHAAVWNGRDASGSPVASGLYLYRIQAGDFVQVRRMVLMK